MNLSEKIIDRINELKIEAFTVNDIIDLGTYDNLRKTLERMVKQKKIRRLIRGVYDIPKLNNTFNILNPPSIDGVAKALARSFNWDISPSGNYALNILGLSTQVPSKYVYISSGPYREYIVDNLVIEFRHASLKEIKSFSYNTNLVIQSLKELGKDNITDDILKIISNKFTFDEILKICDEAKHTTIWIYVNILKIRGIKDEKNN